MDRNTTVFSASPFATNPRPRHHRRRFFATSRFLSSSRPRTLSVILELRYSDIACRRLLPPFVASSPANYSPSSINALNGNISRPRSTRALAGSFFQYFRLKRDRDGRCVFFKEVFCSRALRNTQENFRIFLQQDYNRRTFETTNMY